MSKNINIDYINNSIVITKKFAKAAGILGSKEYNEMKQIRADYPTFQIVMKEIKKKEGKKSYRNLTFDNMRAFIVELVGADSPKVQNFDKVRELSKAQAGPYAYVKVWFLKNFGEEYESAQKALGEDENKAA